MLAWDASPRNPAPFSIPPIRSAANAADRMGGKSVQFANNLGLASQAFTFRASGTQNRSFTTRALGKCISAFPPQSGDFQLLREAEGTCVSVFSPKRRADEFVVAADKDVSIGNGRVRPSHAVATIQLQLRRRDQLAPRLLVVTAR